MHTEAIFASENEENDELHGRREDAAITWATCKRTLHTRLSDEILVVVMADTSFLV